MNRVFIAIFSIIFLTTAIVFVTYPRSTYSELEKRDLATFPKFDIQKLAEGKFTTEVTAWFSDSEPYRDVFMTLSMNIKDYIKLNVGGDDNITFITKDEGSVEDNETHGDNADDMNTYQNTADENAKMATRGIIIVGEGPNVRALESYGGDDKGGVKYAEAANAYAEAFAGKVQIYCMVIPTATEFYLPEKAQSFSKKQLPTIRNIYKHLDPRVKAVDCYTPLSKHVNEYIYLRTDHHWSPLGAFYAAQQFAKVAGVPFKELTSYEKHVIHGYVGSMYGYSHDIAIKNAPEDFVFYKPKGINYNTTYINYTINKSYQVVRESAPVTGEFFYTYPDGSGGAYCTFMGGDTKITQVRTGTKNGRRLIILKDSFGNAIPGYLFYSFEEIHVIDCRYFTKNMRKYVADNKITDILFGNNIYNAYASSRAEHYMKFLNQSGAQLASPTPSDQGSNKPKAKPAEAKKDPAEVKQVPVETKQEAKPAEAPKPAETPKAPETPAE